MADEKAQPDDRKPEGGRPQEKVEDRPVVGTTTPDAYPDKAKGQR